jgi:hypothetical protein
VSVLVFVAGRKVGVDVCVIVGVSVGVTASADPGEVVLVGVTAGVPVGAIVFL